MTLTSAFALTSDSAHPWPRVWVHDEDSQLIAAVALQLRATALEVTTFDSTDSLLVALERERPNCLVLPLSPVSRALIACARSRGTRLPVVFISDPVDVGGSVQAMKDGAADVLARPVDLGALLAAVMRGLALDAEWREAFRRSAEALDRLEALTPREREVLGLVATGKVNRHIAAELGTSEKTVKVHRGRVMHKLQAKSIVDLVRLLAHAGLAPI
jgi:FixJ family two-component response regulator